MRLLLVDALTVYACWNVLYNAWWVGAAYVHVQNGVAWFREKLTCLVVQIECQIKKIHNHLVNLYRDLQVVSFKDGADLFF